MPVDDAASDEQTVREATIHIPLREFASLGVREFVTRFREAGLRSMSELACQGDGCLLVLRVEEPMPEESLGDLPGVVWWERLADGGETVAYLVKLHLPPDKAHVEPISDKDVSNGDIRVRDDGIEVTIVGEQTALAESVAEYDEAGVDVGLRGLSDYRGPGESLESLTERQREVIGTAWDAGYFEIPRRASATDVAETLDLDPSTVTEHLRRAQANLLREHFGDC